MSGGSAGDAQSPKSSPIRSPYGKLKEPDDEAAMEDLALGGAASTGAAQGASAAGSAPAGGEVDAGDVSVRVRGASVTRPPPAVAEPSPSPEPALDDGAEPLADADEDDGIRSMGSRRTSSPKRGSSLPSLRDEEVGGAAGGHIADDDEELGAEMCCGLRYSTRHYEIGPYHWSVYREDAAQVKAEVLAGLTVAFAQVSESMAFAFIAGVGPMQGLHAAWIIGLTLSFFGSRTAMINGATGVRAAVVAPYVAEHGVGMLFYIVLVISVFQAAAAMLRVAQLVRLVPRPAMIGFVNGLAIILAMGQIQNFQLPGSDEWRDQSEVVWMWVVVATTVAFSVGMPKVPYIGGVLPPSLFGIVGAVIVEFGVVRAIFDASTPTIGDISTVTAGFPTVFWEDPQHTAFLPPFNWETIKTASGPAFIAAAAGLVEAVMTMEVVTDLTETSNPNPNQQLLALSLGNFISGLFGTLGGGATIGLSMINCHNGANGKYRISGIVAGIVVLLLILVATPVIKIIPTASLVGVMVIVCFHTFDWASVPTIIASAMPLSIRTHSLMTARAERKIRRIDALVIVTVTVVTLLVDLFTAVAAGICITACAFAWQEASLVKVTSRVVERSVGSASADGSDSKADDASKTLVKVHKVEGAICFASAMDLTHALRPRRDDPDDVEIHLHASQVADYSGIHMLNVLGEKYADLGKRLHVRKLNWRSQKLLSKAKTLVSFTYDVQEEAEAADVQLGPAQRLTVEDRAL